MSRWSQAGTWVGDGLRREVFFFGSGGVDLYGSLYTGSEPSRPFGIVACGSWGVEADRSDPLLRSVALAMARLGGTAMVFHYPGYGDSYGDLASVSLADLTKAARDAVAEASRRRPGTTWILAGFMFGAAVACLVRRMLAPSELLLVQPALRPAVYFQQLSERTQSLAPGHLAGDPETVSAELAYGYPIPRRIAEQGAERDAEALRALAAPGGEATVIHYATPGEDGSIPAGVERVEVPGAWRFGSTLDPDLVGAAAGWLDRRTRGSG